MNNSKKVHPHVLAPSWRWVVMAVCIISHFNSAAGHEYFQATLANPSDDSSFANVTAYIHDGEWTWSMNTSAPVELAQISDRRGAAEDPVFRPLVTYISKETTSLNTTGMFGSEDVMTENAADLFKNASIPAAQALAGHMCMGHIFAVVNGVDGDTYYAPMTFMGEGDCYESTGNESMRMKMGHSDMDMEMANGPMAADGPMGTSGGVVAKITGAATVMLLMLC
jgi:hypothetical protein